MKDLKKLLDSEYEKRNSILELNKNNPDPLMIAKKYFNEYISLTCALFSYGKASNIVNFLEKLPFDIIDRSVKKETIQNRIGELKYRFQTSDDIIEWFWILQKIRMEEKKLQKLPNPKISLLEETFKKGYLKNNNVIEGIEEIITLLNSFKEKNSKGLNFLIGKNGTTSPLKRYNMFLRWMVRKDNLDLGDWNFVNTKDLIIPLDIHLFRLGKEMGLISKNKYCLESAIEMTKNLKKFDENDPVKYDFAIYRIGQNSLNIKNK